MGNEICYWTFCFVPISQPSAATKIFGFSEFLAALALLAVVYTISDARTKFRIAVTPTPLYGLTFCITATIGVCTLLTDVWLAEGWWVPKVAGITASIWQGILGLLFLGTFSTWMYYAFIRPPVFGRRNRNRYIRTLYAYILRGNEEELKIIANELARSARPIVRNSLVRERVGDANGKPAKKITKNTVHQIAYELILLIADRRFCRFVVRYSPITAHSLFQEIASSESFGIPIGQFARNITSEAISQPDSFLYAESEGYNSGLLGYVKPFTKSLYGNYRLIEDLASNSISPLDVDYDERNKWSGIQWSAYCKATLMLITSCLDSKLAEGHSYAIYRALDDIEGAFRFSFSKDIPDVYESSDYEKLRVIAGFITDVVRLLDKHPNRPPASFKSKDGISHTNIYDYIAKLFFEMCFSTSAAKLSIDTAWGIHYGTVWNSLFGNLSEDGPARKIIKRKACRLLYEEIARMNTFSNFKGAKVLGYCLNVLGVNLERSNANRRNSDTYALAKVTQDWASKNYLRMREENEEVANAVLLGRLTFDEERCQLVITYLKGLNKEAPKSSLVLVSRA